MGRRPGSWDPPAWGGPWKGLLLAASVLGSCLQPAPAQTPVSIVLTPPKPVVGGGVSLAPQNPPQDVRTCSWYRSATTAEPSRILTYYPPPNPDQQNGPAHTGRETAGPGCALNIAGLMFNYTGSYTVQILSPTSPRLGSVHLPVYEMLSRPTVTPNQTQVLENGNFTLRCNSSPSADTVLWLRDGASLAPSDRLGLSPDNRTLTVLGVTRDDAGAYQCEVRNPVSTNCSENSNVTVAYGPDSVRIDPPGPIALTLGSPRTLTCVSDSVPAPSYRWGLNGTDANKTGSSLTFNPTTLDHQGTYECWAHNSITNRTAWASVPARFGASPADSSGGLSPGAIAGIVIGSLIAVALLLGVLLYFLLCRTGGETKQHSPVGGQATPAHNEGVSGSKPTLGEEDIQYSTLAFSAGDQKPPPGPQTPPEGGTVYSEIRKK